MRKRFKYIIATYLCLLMLISCKEEQSTQVTEVEFQPIISNFDSSNEGWKINGNGPSTIPDFFSSGGVSGGFISDEDERFGEWYFIPPQKFLGTVSGAYGKFFEFWLKQTQSQSDDHKADIFLSGSGITVYHNFSNNPDTIWTKYRIRLNETGGWYWENWFNRTVTQEEMKSILKNVTGIKIRGDYYTGTVNDTVSLDQVHFGIE